VGRPRVLIVDDDEVIRYILRRIMESECEVIAEAGNGCEAITAAESLRPDIIVLDISMPILGGFEAARHIRKRAPDIHIIFASQHTNRTYVEEAFRLGAKGYVTKQAADKELPQALREVLAGSCFRSPLTHGGERTVEGMGS
jgi:DNA-binding NarL/FixJ family response regulator